MGKVNWKSVARLGFGFFAVVCAGVIIAAQVSGVFSGKKPIREAMNGQLEAQIQVLVDVMRDVVSGGVLIDCTTVEAELPEDEIPELEPIDCTQLGGESSEEKFAEIEPIDCTQLGVDEVPEDEIPESELIIDCTKL